MLLPLPPWWVFGNQKWWATPCTMNGAVPTSKVQAGPSLESRDKIALKNDAREPGRVTLLARATCLYIQKVRLQLLSHFPSVRTALELFQ